MFKDIRSFFSVISKKSGTEPPKTKKTAKPLIQSDDEDIIPETPSQKKKTPIKKRKVISSDSEDEKRPKQTKKVEATKKKNLKPLSSLEDAFGSAPVKQKKAEAAKSRDESEVKTELGVHGDPAFEKTLLDLDDELLEQNADALDKTIEEALAKNGKSSKADESVGGKY